MLDNLFHILASPAKINLAGWKMEGPAIIVIPSLVAIIALALWSIAWIYKDAVRREKNGVVAVCFILLCGWPLSFLWWLWLRPPVAGEEIDPHPIP